ncbi:MAG: polyphosphate kinase 1 [Spirochaetia bacterium]|nr:polyphosphate kinase 1 [Spirochaetia bacterium]
MESVFFNRELSWIEFNARILFHGLRQDIPLLERLQFISIVTSNFDEFFQVRVASVKRQLFSEPGKKDISGLLPEMVLHQISARAHKIFRDQYECLNSDILPKLAEKNLEYIKPENFSEVQVEFIQDYFQKEIFPILTPLRTDTEIFPHIANLRRYAAFLLEPIAGIKSQNEELKGSDDETRIALVEIPENQKQIIYLPSNSEKKQFCLLEDIILNYGRKLFPGLNVTEYMTFKISRDADFAVDEDSRTNFIHEMEKVLVQRQSSFAVQMTCNPTSEKLLKFLQEKLELTDEDIYKVSGALNPSVFMELRENEEAKKLSFPSWNHYYPTDLPEDKPYWDVLKQHDVLLNVPYESYDPVIKFISDAADDPNVLTIKMTLYRTGKDSPIIEALERAARNGKQVVVLVELKARFDEERNIAWANELENAGVTVIYGLVNLKVHAKILMIIRREEDSIRRYAHLSTGNYNPKTAKLYSDLSLFTANSEITNDATQFFNLVTGYSNLQTMKNLGMAPVSLKQKILMMIQREIDIQSSGGQGIIIAKMNSLTHEEVINALYNASQHGVKIYLNVRGICMLVPGVKGLSENIKVISIVDRYLEHARIFYFQNGNSPELYLSSADWMPRNLDRRIELMFPILDHKVFSEIKSILNTYFDDNSNAHYLTEDGIWNPVVPNKKDEIKRAQEILQKKYKNLFENSVKLPKNQFEVRRKD